MGFCPAADSVEVTLLPLLGAAAGAGAAWEETARATSTSSSSGARKEAARSIVGKE